jgi:hypothetical protein
VQDDLEDIQGDIESEDPKKKKKKKKKKLITKALSNEDDESYQLPLDEESDIDNDSTPKKSDSSSFSKHKGDSYQGKVIPSGGAGAAAFGGDATKKMLAGLKIGMKKNFASLKDQLNQDEIKAILASKDCPKARTFGEMIPLAYAISKKNI